MYIDVLHRLRDAVRRERHEKWRISSWFPRLNNAPALRSVLVKDFVAKNNVTTLEHPPFSSGPTPVYFYLFSQLKSALKKRHFCDDPDIITNAAEELKRLLQNGFQECFQNLYSQRQKCIFARGDYCEGNVA